MGRYSYQLLDQTAFLSKGKICIYYTTSLCKMMIDDLIYF